MRGYIVPGVLYRVEEIGNTHFDVWLYIGTHKDPDNARSEADYYAAKHKTRTRVCAVGVENSEHISVIAEYGKRG